MSGTNGINSRLEKKAKRGWAAFFQSENRHHDNMLGYCEKNQYLQKKLEELNKDTNIPDHISNEIKELYDLVKKEVSCPICLDVIPTKDIKFTSCGHKYCDECLKKLKTMPNRKCAICRRKIY